MNQLESRYRRLLFAYPDEYREEREDELVGTLMELAGEDRTWPRPSEAVDLIFGGLRARAWRSTRGHKAALATEGLRQATLLAVVVLAGVSAALLWLLARDGMTLHPYMLEPVETLMGGGPITYALPYVMWLVVLAALLAGRRRLLQISAVVAALSATGFLALYTIASPTPWIRFLHDPQGISSPALETHVVMAALNVVPAVLIVIMAARDPAYPSPRRWGWLAVSGVCAIIVAGVSYTWAAMYFTGPLRGVAVGVLIAWIVGVVGAGAVVRADPRPAVAMLIVTIPVLFLLFTPISGWLFGTIAAPWAGAASALVAPVVGVLVIGGLITATRAGLRHLQHDTPSKK